MRQSGTYQGSNFTSFPAYAPPCDRCRLTACHSIHDHAAPSCHPLQFCEVCTDLAQLDQQVAAVQDQLLNLARKRWMMKSRFNDHHDQLTRRLPMEIVSDIFLLVEAARQNSSFDVWFTGFASRPSILLGSICKKWRDITLGLPKLWCTLNIKPWNPKFSFNSTEEWLRRSSEVPLSVTYRDDSWGGGVSRTAPKHVVNLLRSQAIRWKHFTFSGPWKSFYDLFHNINDIVSLNTLDITITHVDTIEMGSIQLHKPICPKELTTNSVPISKLPIQWNNLTHLDASSMHLDELLHVIHHATKLTSCIVKYLLENGINYPLPTTPIVHQAMTFLKLENPIMEYSDLVPYLTLPSLKTLDYHCEFDSFALDALVYFFDRSRAPLHTFIFNTASGHVLIPWYERLSAITHLNFSIHQYDQLNTSEEFLNALSRTTGTLTLPHLQELQIVAHSMSKFSWSSFCDIFKVIESEDVTPEIVTGGAGIEVTENLSDQQTVGERHTRPLKSVYIRLIGDGQLRRSIAEEDIFSKLLNIGSSGVRLEITDLYDGNDLVECAAKIITNRELPFSGDESWNELTGNGWESD